ncbi:MAG: DnaK suppressor protein [Gammaproteobacteria bacterium]|jgi:DnaK suppressor protein|nr:DnaK suppressor protein [Gammaproteobacteria bacterium]
MPTKKPKKAAKKPGKATPGKVSHKLAAQKKAARPLLKPSPMIATSKVPVKPNKPVPKSTAAKPATAKATRVKSAPIDADNDDLNGEKLAPIKFDTRPLVLPTRPAQNDDDSDVDPSLSASLLAGPRNVKPYIPARGEQYMNKEQLEHFAQILQSWKRDLMVEVDRTVLHMKDEAANFPDPNDRATQEEEFSLELRTRDRERKLIRKIDEALKRTEDGSYGYCLETGEEIGIKRLEARPVATLSVEAQERRERREKQYGDRDDRYR